MRVAVTGSKGQVVTSLLERGQGRAEIVALGRPIWIYAIATAC
jgi:dTDP-4-dehydrorhamnose reductase